MKATFLFLSALAATGVASGEPDFRQSSWGDSMDAVIAVEGEPEKRDRLFLHYSDEIAGVPYFVAFEFEGGRLKAGAYMSNSQVDAAGKLAEYERFEEILTIRHDTAGRLDTVFDDPSGKGLHKHLDLAIPDDKSSAVAFGFWKESSYRESERTLVRHGIEGDGEPTFSVHHFITYRSTFDVTPPEIGAEDLRKL